jgi:hypothetical protein
VKLLAAATVAVAATAASGAAPAPQLGGCPVFPTTSVWNAPVNTLPAGWTTNEETSVALAGLHVADRPASGTARGSDPLRRRARQDDTCRA